MLNDVKPRSPLVSRDPKYLEIFDDQSDKLHKTMLEKKLDEMTIGAFENLD